MDLETVGFEKKNGIARLTLNRPKAMNALNSQMAHDLIDAFSACESDPEVRVVILTGAGRAFCAGGDVAAFHENIEGASGFLRRLTVPFHAAVSRMARMDKIVIGAINGVAAGGGMGLAMAPDLAIATESAVFNMAYTGIGASPDGSSTYFLPRLIGIRRAMELALLNRVLTAAEALDWGLVNKVVPDADFAREVDRMAERFARGPLIANGATKRLLRQSLHNSLETHLETEAASISAMGATADFREGVAAFVEKRKPEFQGK